MKRRFSLALIFALVPAGGAALAACVGDEPAPVTPVYVERDSGQDDATPPDGGGDQNTPWNPNKVGGLFLWLDGADGVAVKRGTDNRVTEWSDKSPKARNFKPPVEGNGPFFTTSAIGGKTAVAFTATSQHYLVGPSFSDLRGAHAFAIYKTLSPPGARNGFWKFSSGDFAYMPFDNNLMYDGFGANVRQLTGVAQPNAAVAHLYEVVSTVNHWAGSFDGDPKTGQSTTTNTVEFFAEGSLLGASSNTESKLNPSFYFSGIFGEVIIYDHELPDSDVASVRDYLSTKWQISIAKPDGG